jgi:hypothetical protein
MSESENKRKMMEETRQKAWSTAASRREDIERMLAEGPKEDDGYLIQSLLSLVLGEMAYRFIDTSEGI